MVVSTGVPEDISWSDIEDLGSLKTNPYDVTYHDFIDESWKDSLKGWSRKDLGYFASYSFFMFGLGLCVGVLTGVFIICK